MTMTAPALDATDRRLIDDWQRALPLVPRPFARIAAALGTGEAETLARLARLVADGIVSRVGATLRPNTAGASTLAALAAPADRIEAAAAAIGAEPGVNHAYLREHDRNLWFVATGPDRAHVDATLARIVRATGFAVLDLPLVRPFNIDLGFPLSGGGAMAPARAGSAIDLRAIEPGDRALMQVLTDGLALVPRPFAAAGRALGRSEGAVIARIGALAAAGVLSRLGVIVRHRALGWTANAMVVWQAAVDAIGTAGPRLAAVPGVTLCYQRRAVPGAWPYTLYAMIHARSRAEALAVLARAEPAAGLVGVPRAVLFSLRCYRQRGALVALPAGGEAAP